MRVWMMHLAFVFSGIVCVLICGGCIVDVSFSSAVQLSGVICVWQEVLWLFGGVFWLWLGVQWIWKWRRRVVEEEEEGEGCGGW